jgi:accessory gene regulator protein AgrB
MKKMNQKKKREEKVRMNKVKKMNGINKKKVNIQMSIIVKNLTTLLLRANLL